MRMPYKIKSIVTRKLEGENHFHFCLCHQLKGGGMEISMERRIPILWKNKEECFGCTACVVSCPQNTIEMKKDNEGFWYPYIKENGCIACYKCIKVCPLKHRG